MAKKAAKVPALSDPFLRVVSSTRDFAIHMVRSASWALTLACGCAFASRLAWPLLPDDITLRCFLSLFALSLGACIGRPIDRRLARFSRNP